MGYHVPSSVVVECSPGHKILENVIFLDCGKLLAFGSLQRLEPFSWSTVLHEVKYCV